MIEFKEYLDLTTISEEELDSLMESVDWDEVEDDEFEALEEALTSAQRLKKAQQLRARKALMALARKIKLKRAAGQDVITKRSKVAARNSIYRKLLKGRTKSQLSAGEKAALEKRVSTQLTVMKNLPQRLIPKERELDRARLRHKK